MKPPPFSYECPVDLAGAFEALASHRGDGQVLAGGQSLVPLLNFRLFRPRVLIDVNRVEELDFIRLEGDVLHIGALVRHAQIEQSPEVARHAALMAEAVSHVGHAQIRNRGTIGGSLAHADPAAELPAALMALEARFVAGSTSGSRVIGHDEFFLGPFTTALSDDELLTAVEVPLPPPGTGHSFYEFARRRGDFALGGAAVLVTVDEQGLCRRASIALVSADATPVRATTAEELLIGETANSQAIDTASDEAVREISPLSDVHGSDTFRRRVIRELVKRALESAFIRARAAREADL
jgi:CO/xanthine dehydrogenase FAD-binding subunit